MSASKQFDTGVLVNHTVSACDLTFKTSGGTPLKPTFTLLQVSFLAAKVIVYLLLLLSTELC